LHADHQFPHRSDDLGASRSTNVALRHFFASTYPFVFLISVIKKINLNNSACKEIITLNTATRRRAFCLSVHIRRNTVIDNSKLVLVAVVGALGFASPAFAQASKPDNAPHRSLQARRLAPKTKLIAADQSGLHAYAQTPSPSTSASFNRYDPSLTGGGSVGYNTMYSQDGSAQTLPH
jgi:hypothetical protein